MTSGQLRFLHFAWYLEGWGGVAFHPIMDLCHQETIALCLKTQAEHLVKKPQQVLVEPSSKDQRNALGPFKLGSYARGRGCTYIRNSYLERARVNSTSEACRPACGKPSTEPSMDHAGKKVAQPRGQLVVGTGRELRQACTITTPTIIIVALRVLLLNNSK